MRKLNKTEAKLMADLKTAYMGRICVTSFLGNGADGGRVRGGSRAVNAAIKLEKLGLLTRVKIDSYQHYQNGWCIHATDWIFTAPTKETPQ